jgi:hypothetical protein
MAWTRLRSYGEIAPKLAEDEKLVRRRAKADNPPVNSRISFVLLAVAASCLVLPDGVYPKESQ